ADQFQLSSVTDELLARGAVSTNNVPSSILSHTRRLCGNGVCRGRHAPCPPTNGSSSLSSFDFSDERLSQLINQYPLTTTTPP
ncbi:unnamed protein product, partial [Rotaria sp. Silwood1]